jgi:hypothetical protein
MNQAWGYTQLKDMLDSFHSIQRYRPDGTRDFMVAIADGTHDQNHAGENLIYRYSLNADVVLIYHDMHRRAGCRRSCVGADHEHSELLALAQGPCKDDFWRRYVSLLFWN